jgi:hypothetical protein
VLRSGFPPDPRFEPHSFQGALWNPKFCSYCSEPESTHGACGHALITPGCETCARAIFSEEHVRRLRNRNLRAMRRAGIQPASGTYDLPGGRRRRGRYPERRS